MKKNYSVPQIEVSEMMAGTLMQSSTSSTIGQSTAPENSSTTGSSVTNQPATQNGSASAKHTTDHFNF